MVICNKSTIRVTIKPKDENNGNVLRQYALKVEFPLMGYTHEETIIAPSEEDAKTTAMFIARSVTHELQAQLADAAEHVKN